MTADNAELPAERPKRRIVFPQPICALGTGAPDREMELLNALGPDTVMMMGDNPALPAMPAAPTLFDFFRLRFRRVAYHHLLHSAYLAREAGQGETLVLACLLHDIANGALFRADHGYWGAQMIAPHVSEEVAWAVEKHQALRFFPDEAVGYGYPDSYLRFFGPDYAPPLYIRQAYDAARNHRWYITARMITVFDVYSFGGDAPVGLEAFEDVVGRHFRQPPEGLGFDGSPVAHMWRSMIWPNNFL